MIKVSLVVYALELLLGKLQAETLVYFIYPIISFYYAQTFRASQFMEEPVNNTFRNERDKN